jgi:hypothetical protein
LVFSARVVAPCVGKDALYVWLGEIADELMMDATVLEID